MKCWSVYILALLLMAAGSAKMAQAQVPLSAVNEETVVDEISFRFVDDGVFRENILRQQLWHQEAGFWDKVTNLLPFVTPTTFPFSPIELQKDVVRLERYYQRNGFLHPEIDYPASQVDTSDNDIHIIFTVRSGPPLILQDVGFYTGEGAYTSEAFSGDLRQDWIRYRDQVILQTGTRYTEFEGIRLQDEVLGWFKNAGFAFATIDRETIIDSTANTVDLRFHVSPGPRGYVSEIQIEGNESVSDQVVLRELPFSVGDRFSAEELTEGQQELFGLNLFRVAIAEVPEQPEDSTVIVRYRLREARPRQITAQTGYALDQGAQLQGSWTHRNFLGGARQFNVTATYSSGIGATRARGSLAAREKGISLSLRQPYLFSRKLSGVISPSYTRGEEPLLDLRYEEAEVNTTLLYTIYNFRTVQLRHRLSRVQPLGSAESIYIPRPDTFSGLGDLNVFNQHILSLSANLGRVDDFLRPNSGFLIRPLVEMGGIIVNLPDDVDYYKAQIETIGYLPLNEDYSLTGRLFLGNIWPRGESRQQVTSNQIEFRFDRIRYYAGGANDVRGWPLDLLGPVVPVVDTLSQVAPHEPDSINVDRLEAWGGLAKVAANIELRTPMPLLGPDWRGAVFLDMGQVFPTEAVEESFRFRDVSFSDLRFGTGVGLRYQTVVGFIRLDLAYKINPTILDLASPTEVYLLQSGQVSDIKTNWWDRFRLHLSIGQTF